METVLVLMAAVSQEPGNVYKVGGGGGKNDSQLIYFHATP